MLIAALFVVLSGCATHVDTNAWNRSVDFETQAKMRVGTGLTLKALDGKPVGKGFWKNNGGGMGIWEKVLVLMPGSHSIAADLRTPNSTAYNVVISREFAAGHLYELAYEIKEGWAVLVAADVTENSPPIWKELLSDMRKNR